MREGEGGKKLRQKEERVDTHTTQLTQYNITHLKNFELLFHVLNLFLAFLWSSLQLSKLLSFFIQRFGKLLQTAPGIL